MDTTLEGMGWRRMTETGAHCVMSSKPPKSVSDHMGRLAGLSEAQTFKEMRRKLEDMEKTAAEFIAARSRKGH